MRRPRTSDGRTDPHPHLPVRATLLGLSAVLLWSTVATAFKLALRHLDPLQLVLLASATSAFVLAAIAAVRVGPRALRKEVSGELLRSALFGLLNPFAYYIVLFGAYDLLPAQQAQALNYTWGITMALLAVPILGQRLRRRELAALVVCYGGVVVIVSQGDLVAFRFASLPGVGLALLSTLLWSVSWLASAKRAAEPAVGLALNFAFGTLYALVAVLAFSRLPPLSLSACLGAAYVGVVEMGVTFLLWLSALRLSPSTARIASLIYLSPFLSLVFIGAVLGEDIVPSTVVGLGAIVLGVALVQSRPAELP